MTKRRGRLLEELSLIQRVPVGYEGLLKMEAIRPDSPIIVHRRGLKMANYNARDPREQWAVPRSEVTGTLPERIMYKSLQERHLIPSVFTFQSTTIGGRLELGGMVADFLSNIPPMVIRIQGSYWHGEFDRQTGDLMSGDIVQGRKDDEQGQILTNMGYAVYDCWEQTCYDPYLLEAWLNRYVDSMLAGMTTVNMYRTDWSTVRSNPAESWTQSP